jgi:D-alanyl-D-alanine dipeptidase
MQMTIRYVCFQVVFSLTLLVALASCKTDIKHGPAPAQTPAPQAHDVQADFDTSLWTELKVEDGYVIDMRYATADNFVKEVIYPCARFFLRPEVASALAEVKKELLPLGYKLKLFDGYRPRPAQQKLWDKVPNPDYVASPKEGSMHNRGVAIDLSMTDLNGQEIDMGTTYDFFGPEAHRDYQNLPPVILDYRRILRSAMEAHGFQSIRTEWWHFSFNRGSYPLDDWQWPCTD